jgi:hypothetical protein
MPVHPDDEDKPFGLRWNKLVQILLVESSVKLVARAAADYADFRDGTECRPSNERLARETGYSERTVRTAWGVLRGLGMAERVRYAQAHAHRADVYDLRIPPDWKGFPVLGPHGRKFTCLHCGKLFNPQGNNTLRPDGKVGFRIERYVFCPRPRKGPSCRDDWDTGEATRGRPLFRDADQWKAFRTARGDEW